jgi:myo-inositol-1(or 4)-monophosphatase
MRDELKLAMQAARQAGALTLKYHGGKGEINDKRDSDKVTDGDFNPLTQADLEADAYIKEVLRGAFPDYGWLSEETVDSPERLDKEAVWIVDPIDGTREFVQGLPEYVVSIALVEKGEPVVGVIFNPVTDDLYAAVKGGGTHLNGKRVFCSEVSDISQASLTVSRSEDRRGEIDPYRDSIGQIKPMGSVAYKLALVSGGQADFNISVQPKNEWDVVAGDLLVREAGGHMLDLDGKVRLYNQKDPLINGGLAAGPTELVAAFLALRQDLRQESAQ